MQSLGLSEMGGSPNLVSQSAWQERAGTHVLRPSIAARSERFARLAKEVTVCLILSDEPFHELGRILRCGVGAMTFSR